MRDPGVLYLAAFIAIGATFAVLGPALTLLREQVGTDVGGIGIIFTAQGAGYLVGALFFSRAYDRGLGHRLMSASLFIAAGALLVVPLVNTLAGLCAVLFVVGLSTSTVDVGGNTLIVWRGGPSTGSWMSALHFSFGLGALMSPVLVYLSQVSRDDVALACWVIAGYSVVVAIAARFVKAPLPPRRDLHDANPPI